MNARLPAAALQSLAVLRTDAPAIVAGEIMHRRTRPAANAFTYPAFCLRLPLSQLSELPARGVAWNRKGDPDRAIADATGWAVRPSGGCRQIDHDPPRVRQSSNSTSLHPYKPDRRAAIKASSSVESSAARRAIMTWRMSAVV